MDRVKVRAVLKQMRANPIDSRHVLGIDSLRALAVLAVIFYHLEESFLPGGFVGVDIFFAISGFVITKSLVERRPKSVLSFFTGFYRRRFVRIAPALFVYLFIVAGLASYFIPKASLSGGIYETAKWAIFGISNIQLVESSDGYFAERMDFNPFIQTWSLGVEEQFYLVYPLILASLVFALLKSRKLLANISVVLLAALTLVSLVISFWQTNQDQLSAFYLLPSRFWELSLGGLLYLLVTQRNLTANLSSSVKRSLFLAGSLLVILSLILANDLSFPFWWALPPVLGTLLLIDAANNLSNTSESRLAKVLTSRPIVYLGKISFSLYLWHWGIFVLMRWTIGLYAWWQELLGLALTLVAGALSYKFVETPVRTGKLIVRQPDWRLILTGTTVAVLVLTAVNFSYAESIRKAKSIGNPEFTDRKAISLKLASIPKSDLGLGKSIIFVGDSHAGHYKYLGKWIAKKTGAEFKSIINVGCVYVNLQPATDIRLSRCPSAEEITEEALALAKPGDTIVLSSFSTPRIATLDAAQDHRAILSELNSPELVQGREAELQKAIPIVSQLQDRGLTVVLAGPTPVFVTPADRCMRWFNRINPICSNGFQESTSFQIDLRKPVMKSYQALSQATGATIWDPFPTLCPNREVCYSMQGKRYFFLDQHHLTANGNLLLIDSFLSMLSSLWMD